MEGGKPHALLKRGACIYGGWVHDQHGMVSRFEGQTCSEWARLIMELHPIMIHSDAYFVCMFQLFQNPLKYSIKLFGDSTFVSHVGQSDTTRLHSTAHF